MAEELMVVLSRSEHLGFGFSLLGTVGLPHVIYDIVENSPAAECGEVEAGDVILKVNETDVHCFTTKEVLKCLRLSTDPVTLRLKRDPQIKAHVRRFLTTENQSDPVISSMADRWTPMNTQSVCIPRTPTMVSVPPNGSSWTPLPSAAQNTNCHFNAQQHRNGHSREKPHRCEAFMMTGDLILNLSRTQQGSGLLPKHCKKVDSLRFGTDPPQATSVPTSPTENDSHRNKVQMSSAGSSPLAKRSDFCEVSDDCKGFTSFVRTSRSEDHLQFQKDSLSAVAIDFNDDDVTSSLNTLLDTRHDSDDSNHVSNDRIVWTYNAPVTSTSEHNSCNTVSNNSSGHSFDSPMRSGSPASPTSVSSSVMSSNSGSKLIQPGPHGDANQMCVPNANGDLSASEAVSNISSPDFQEEETMDILSARDLMMGLSDASDSDSTILVSEGGRKTQTQPSEAEHKIIIQVKGPDGAPESHGYYELRESEDELATITEDVAMTHDSYIIQRGASPTVSNEGSDDGSDADSLHSFHYSPKAVDIPSAVRLAKRLYMLDGFKKSDVSRHLSKNNDFSRAVAEEYLRYFNFEHVGLDVALRTFLKQFSLSGETQERERVLVHFSKRYLDCNPGTFNSQDAVHTLTCAIMLLNTDLHGQNIGRKMTCAEFIENLSELNDGENFPRDVLKLLYVAIKAQPLEWAIDEETEDNGVPRKFIPEGAMSGGNPFLDLPDSASAVEYKKGYVMRKCCFDPNAKKTPFGKRSWKMFYCTLRDLVLYLHKDEHGFRKSQMSDNFHNAIRIHHALATKAQDYTKKQHVFRLQTADQAEYLFQTSDSKELQSWIDTINFVCASFSAQPLEGAVGSQRKFQRPLLPCSHTKLNLREQLAAHEERVQMLETTLEDHRRNPPDRNCKGLNTQNYREKDAYLHYELKRYKVYANLLRSRLSQYPEIEGVLGEAEECLMVPPVPDRPLPNANNRYNNSISNSVPNNIQAANNRLDPNT